MAVSFEEFLEHHGVKGMKWGVVQQKRSEHRERAAKKHDAEAARTQARIDRITNNPSKFGIIRAKEKLNVKELERHRDIHTKAANDLREGHMTDHQKRILIGAGVTAGILATYGTYKVLDTGSGRQILSSRIPFKKDSSLSGPMSADDILKKVVYPINPDYGAFGTKNNCRRATFAYEMRRRGFDVQATRTLSGAGQNVPAMVRATTPGSKIGTGRLTSLASLGKELAERQANPGAKIGPLEKALGRAHGLGEIQIGDNDFHLLTPAAKSATIFDTLSKVPNRARGEMAMDWSFGGKHSMAWEIIDGMPHIFDTQTGESYTQAKFASVAGRISQAGISRLDDIPLNEEFLRRWIRNA